MARLAPHREGGRLMRTSIKALIFALALAVIAFVALILGHPLTALALIICTAVAVTGALICEALEKGRR